MSMYEDDYFEDDMINAAEMAAHQRLESAKRTASEGFIHSPDSYDGRMQQLQEENPGVPAYYLFPGGVQVKNIAGHLTSNGGQAVQYVARSTRLDGRNKGEQLADIRKAINMLHDELGRLDDSDV